MTTHMYKCVYIDRCKGNSVLGKSGAWAPPSNCVWLLVKDLQPVSATTSREKAEGRSPIACGYSHKTWYTVYEFYNFIVVTCQCVYAVLDKPTNTYRFSRCWLGHIPHKCLIWWKGCQGADQHISWSHVAAGQGPLYPWLFTSSEQISRSDGMWTTTYMVGYELWLVGYDSSTWMAGYELWLIHMFESTKTTVYTKATRKPAAYTSISFNTGIPPILGCHL